MYFMAACFVHDQERVTVKANAVIAVICDRAASKTSGGKRSLFSLATA